MDRLRKNKSNLMHASKSIAIAVFLICVFTSLSINGFGLVPKIHYAHAAITQYLNFQGKVTNVSDGTNVADGSYSMQFKIYDAATSGNLLWTETWDGTSGTTQVSFANGVFSVKLGTYTSLSSVDFTTKTPYLSVNFNSGSGYDGEMSPRKQLVAAPFAFNSNSTVGTGRIGIAYAPSDTNYSAGTIIYSPTVSSGNNVLALSAGSNVTGTALTVAQAGTGYAATFTGGNVGIGTTTPGAALDVQKSLTSSSGIDYGAKIQPTVNASGTEGYTALLVNATETATGSGTKNLADFQVGGVSKASIDHNGNLTVTSCTGCASGSTAWSALQNPSSNLALSMAGYTSTFTYGAATGSSVNLFNVTDTTSNTGTGYLMNISTATSSALSPFNVAAHGTSALSVSATGLVTANNFGSSSVAITGGSINGTPIGATTASTGAFTTLSATGVLTANNASNAITAGTLTATGGTINGTSIGATTTATGAFTTLSASAQLSANGGIGLPANQNILFASGTGQIGQTYANSSTGYADGIVFTNTNTSTTPAAVSGFSVSPAGSANTNSTNLNVGTNYGTVTPTTGNNFYAMQVGTGYNDILRYNGTQLISGAGLLQSAALSGTYSNALTLSGALTETNASNVITAGTLTATGGTINGTSIGATTASTGAFSTLSASGLISANGGVTIAANQNLALASGSGQFGQSYQSGVTSFAEGVTYTNTNTSATTSTLTGYSMGPTGTANTLGTNNNVGIYAAPVTPLTGNNFYALQVGTGYNDILRYNNTQLISGTGLLQSAALSGTYSNALTLSGALTETNASNIITAGTLTATGGTINGTSIGAITASTGAFTTLSATSATALTGTLSVLSTTSPQVTIGYSTGNTWTTSTTSVGATSFVFNGSAPSVAFKPQVDSTNAFNVTNAAGTSILSVDSTDTNVGINSATTPLASLQDQGTAAITGSGTIAGSSTTITGSGTNFGVQVHVGDTIVSSGQTRVITAIASTTSATVAYAFSPAITAGTSYTYQQPIANFLTSSGTSNFMMAANGSVGFGGVPSSYFEINAGSLASNANLMKLDSSGPNSSVVLNDTATGGLSYALASTGGSSSFGQGAFVISVSASPKLLINSSGFIGLNQSSPAAELDVGGDIVQSSTQSGTSTLANGAGSCSSDTVSATQAVYVSVTAPTTSYIFYNQTRNKHARITAVTNCVNGGTTYQILTTDSITSSASGDTFYLYSGTANIGTSGTTTHGNGFVNTLSAIQAQFVTATTTGGFDVAEEYPTTDMTITPGDVVSVDMSQAGNIVKAVGTPDPGMLGIVSTNPGLSLGNEETGPWQKVALAGRVPVKVSLENGPIAIGDYLTSSSVPGVAMKATKAGPVIARALDAFTKDTSEVDGVPANTIEAFVHPDYYDGSTVTDFFTTEAVRGQSRTTSTTTSAAVDENSTSLQILQNIMNLEKDPNYKPAEKSDILTDRAIALQEIISPKITTGALTVSGPMVLNGGLQVDTLTASGSVLTLASDTLFLGRPYFNTDTAGFAVIKQGQTSVDVTFDKEYLDQPIVNATITEGNDSTAQANVSQIFQNNIQYVVTNKTTTGFTIDLNKAAPNDISFSWITLAVHNPKTFFSAITSVAPVVTTVPVTPVSDPIGDSNPQPTPTPVATPVVPATPVVNPPVVDPTTTTSTTTTAPVDQPNSAAPTPAVALQPVPPVSPAPQTTNPTPAVSTTTTQTN